MGSRPMGRPSGLVCFGCSCWNRQRGSILPPDLVSFLTWTEAVPLLLALSGSFMTVYTSFHHWELMLLMIITFGCMSPTVPQSIAAMNRSLCRGLFCFGFGSLWFSPLSVTFEMGLMTGCLWTSGARAAAFCSPVTLFPDNLCMLSLKQGSCVYWEGVDRCSWGTVHMMSAAWNCVSGRCDIQHVPHDLHTLQHS